MKDIRTAYWLWFFSGFGWLGLHRFYLNKRYTATLWIVSFGLLGIGAIADFFTLKWLVNRYNKIERLKELEEELEKTLEWKKQLAEEDKFEEAAYNRDKAKVLQKQIEKLKNALRINNDLNKHE